MFCRECGKQIPEGSKFCTECGTPIQGPEPAETPASSATAAPSNEAPSSQFADQLISLKSLLDQGIITQEEFDAKKAQILSAPLVSSNNPKTASSTSQTPPAAPAEEGDTIGWAVLGFFIPIVGLILYLVWKDSKPKAAKSAGKGALISVIIGVIGWVLLVAMGACAAGSYY